MKLNVNVLEMPPVQYVGIAVSPLTDFWVSEGSGETDDFFVPCQSNSVQFVRVKV